MKAIHVVTVPRPTSYWGECQPPPMWVGRVDGLNAVVCGQGGDLRGERALYAVLIIHLFCHYVLGSALYAIPIEEQLGEMSILINNCPYVELLDSALCSMPIEEHQLEKKKCLPILIHNCLFLELLDSALCSMPNEEDYAEGEKEDYEKDLEEISSRDQYNLF
jgi:hypothetical protein